MSNSPLSRLLNRLEEGKIKAGVPLLRLSLRCHPSAHDKLLGMFEPAQVPKVSTSFGGPAYSLIAGIKVVPHQFLPENRALLIATKPRQCLTARDGFLLGEPAYGPLDDYEIIAVIDISEAPNDDTERAS